MGTIDNFVSKVFSSKNNNNNSFSFELKTNGHMPHQFRKKFLILYKYGFFSPSRH